MNGARCAEVVMATVTMSSKTKSLSLSLSLCLVIVLLLFLFLLTNGLAKTGLTEHDLSPWLLSSTHNKNIIHSTRSYWPVLP